jgi:hypothetical protein
MHRQSQEGWIQVEEMSVEENTDWSGWCC